MTTRSPQRFIAQIYPRDLRLRILVLRSYCKVSNNLVSDQPSTQAHQINSNLALASFVFQIFWLFTQVQIPISDTNFYLSTYLFPRLSKFLKSEDFSQTGVTKILFLLIAPFQSLRNYVNINLIKPSKQHVFVCARCVFRL